MFALASRLSPTPSWRAGWTVVLLLCLLSSDAGRVLERSIAQVFSGLGQVLHLADGFPSAAPGFVAVLNNKAEPSLVRDVSADGVAAQVSVSRVPQRHGLWSDVAAEARNLARAAAQARAPPVFAW